MVCHLGHSLSPFCSTHFWKRLMFLARPWSWCGLSCLIHCSLFQATLPSLHLHICYSNQVSQNVHFSALILVHTRMCQALHILVRPGHGIISMKYPGLVVPPPVCTEQTANSKMDCSRLRVRIKTQCPGKMQRAEGFSRARDTHANVCKVRDWVWARGGGGDRAAYRGQEPLRCPPRL
jgi:hypothetical protein